MRRAIGGEAVTTSPPFFLENRRRLSAIFWRRPWLKALLLLGPPLAAFLIVYVASLGALFVSSFWAVDSFTGKLEHVWNVHNFGTLLHSGGTYVRIALRTVGLAAAVTVTDAVLAFPLAFFMARVASRRTRALLFVLV